MAANHDSLSYETTWLVRRLFRALAATADNYLRDSGLSAAERAVMEFLYPDECLSVPELALRYDVSRQHVQLTVNGLLQKGLLVPETNPRHKRSPLFRLDDLGRHTFTEIRRNETSEVERIFAGIGVDALSTTHDTLKKLLYNLKQGRSI